MTKEPMDLQEAMDRSEVGNGYAVLIEGIAYLVDHEQAEQLEDDGTRFSYVCHVETVHGPRFAQVEINHPEDDGA